MADDSEWTKLPTEDKCLHKVGVFHLASGLLMINAVFIVYCTACNYTVID